MYDDKRKTVFPLGLLGHEILLVGVVLCVFIAGAFTLAVLLLGWKLALLGSVVGASLMSFIGLPLWVATINDDLEARRS